MAAKKWVLVVAFTVQFWLTYAGLSLLRLLAVLVRARRIVDVLTRRSRRVLYLEPFFPENAGYHYRAELWADALRAKGVDVDVKHVLSRDQHERLLAPGRSTEFHMRWLWKRAWQCMTAVRYRTVVVRREALLFNDYGNLFVERLLRSIHPDLVLDFDDDIAAAKREPRPVGLYGRLVREHGSKFSASLAYYDRFVVGSERLRRLVKDARPDCQDDRILVLPTCVDYDRHPPKEYREEPDATIRFGWVGGTGNLPYLDLVLPALSSVARSRDIELLVVSGEDYAPDVNFSLVNRRWDLQTEVRDLLSVDIGLMPLPDTPVAQGKSGFKLVQYMGLGLVAVASAVGANRDIVEDGVDGFLVASAGDWPAVLEKVLGRYPDFGEIGRRARATATARYTFTANHDRYTAFIGWRLWSQPLSSPPR